jgi:hypothetical protein
VVVLIEQRNEYEAFEQEILANYDPTSALEHQLVARIASLLWRLRRATLIETCLFKAQIKSAQRQQSEARRKLNHPQLGSLYKMLRNPATTAQDPAAEAIPSKDRVESDRAPTADFALAFRRLCRVQPDPLERLSRYEMMLWRQLSQTMIIVEQFRMRKSQSIAITATARINEGKAGSGAPVELENEMGKTVPNEAAGSAPISSRMPQSEPK